MAFGPGDSCRLSTAIFDADGRLKSSPKPSYAYSTSILARNTWLLPGRLRQQAVPHAPALQLPLLCLPSGAAGAAPIPLSHHHQMAFHLRSEHLIIHIGSAHSGHDREDQFLTLPISRWCVGASSGLASMKAGRFKEPTIGPRHFQAVPCWEYRILPVPPFKSCPTEQGGCLADLLVTGRGPAGS